MFEKLRKPGRAKSLMAYVIFGAICLVFVFFGIGPGSLGGLMTGGAAAVVNGEVISIADFRERIRMIEQQTQSQFPDLTTEQREMFLGDARNRALNGLIQSEVLYQKAFNEGVMVSDAELIEYLMGIPAFQEEGRFQRSYYDRYLQMTGKTAKEFESDLRKDLLTNKLREAFLTSIQPLEEEGSKDEMLKSTKADLEFVRINSEAVKKAKKVSAKEVQNFLQDEAKKSEVEAYYTSNKSEYMDKEKKEPKPLEQVQNQIAEELIQQQRLDEGKKGLESALKGQGLQEAKKLVSQMGLKWETTGEFDLSSPRVPKVGLDGDIVDEVLALNEGEALPRLVSKSGADYLLVLKSLKVAEKPGVKQKKSAQPSPMAVRRSAEVFSSWVQQSMEEAKIERNAQLMAQ